MQALLFFALFTLLFGVMGGIVVGSGSSTQQLTKERIAETEQYFKDIKSVVLNELTPNQWKANATGTTDVAQFIRTVPQLQQLSPSKFADKALDPWSNPVAGKIIVENQVIFADAASGAKATVPVTGFLLVSAGPDHVFQTKYTAATTLSSLQGVVPPAGSDDIVYTFTDADAQRDQFQRMRGHVARIGAAALQDYQQRMADYRAARIASYQASLAAGGSIANLGAMMQDDAHAPSFLALATAANRTTLGVDEDFREVESGTSITGSAANQRGKLLVQSSALGNTLYLKVYDSTSPWVGGTGNLLYQLIVKGT